MKNNRKIAALAVLSLALLCVAASIGSARISAADTFRILLSKCFSFNAGFAADLVRDIDPNTLSIVWKLRFPRTLLAFIVGGCLSIGGAVFQSILKNQLASPYMMGVSAGASLGAGLVMVSGFVLPLVGAFTLPAVGFAFGLVTVWLVVAFSSKIDRAMSNNTIILCGMVLSLFINAILTTLVALFREELKTLVIWQMGSFAGRGWLYVRLILPFFVIGTLGVMRYTTEMDMLTFGEEQAKSAGLEAESIKKRLFLLSSILTGSAVSLSGTIGFVDLISPHVARSFVGSKHRYVIPVSFIIGGALMTLSDLAARTLLSPSELPVGAITALIGAPFFAWVYFGKRR